MDSTIIAAMIAAAPAAATTVLAVRQRRHTAATLAQVQNSHSTNLRDDIDDVLAKLSDVLDGQRRHDAEISSLRADMRVERRERLALADRIQERP